jgi:GxxExxY protein
MLKVPSPLTAQTEDLIHRIIGACIAVHRVLGPGLLEASYSRALCIELDASRICYECEKPYPVRYRGQLVCMHRVDLVIANEVVVEVKSVEALNRIFHAQILSYLRVSGLRVGLLVNFNVPIVQDGVKRFVL